jgi:DNA-binding MarR family transcriptional regulator
VDELHEAALLERFLRVLPVFLKRLDSALHEQSDTHRRFTHAQFRVLVLVAEHDQWRMSDLARRMLLSPGSLTLMMDRLIQEELIARGRSESDRRVVVVRITDKGRDMLVGRRAALRRMAEQHIFALPEGERRELLQAIGVLVRFLERQTAPS